MTLFLSDFLSGATVRLTLVTNTGRIALTSSYDTDVPVRMDYNKFRDPLPFHLFPLSSQNVVTKTNDISISLRCAGVNL